MSTWPPSEGLSTIIVPRSATTLTISASTTISAPASFVFDILRDVSRYGEWNTFVPKVTVVSQPDTPEAKGEAGKLWKDTHLIFHVVMDSKKKDKYTDTSLRVTDISTPSSHSSYILSTELESDPSYTSDLNTVYRISWAAEGGWIAKGLRTERITEVVVVGDKECEVRTWECEGGVLAKTVKWMYEKTLGEKFGNWCRDMKGFAERRFGEEGDKTTSEAPPSTGTT